ncbi:polysaccharide deacetylase family protein [Salegentibacter chungangensis]|uniref:Polysaccharide deacetylase family protein n=1 Tax=Salegentibacter chungangensis TaxID=1335724 RepID=A0ABW3NU06_9FLAO
MPFRPYIHDLVGIVLLVTGLLLVYLGAIPLWVVISVILFYSLFLLFVSTNVRFNYFVRSFNHRKGISERKIALSFDDGPVENTLKVLEILDKYEVKAGFFCIGSNIEKHPEIFREIIRRGHVVGNHTYSHTRMLGFLSSKAVTADILKCNEVAERTASVKMKLFRPPFGIVNPKIKRALEATGHHSIGWNIRSFDAIFNSKDLILNRITRKINPGDVILLHDNMLHTPEILEQLLLFLQKNRYKAVRPDNLFEIDAYS